MLFVYIAISEFFKHKKVFFYSYLLQIKFIHENGIGIIIGLIAGFIIYLIDPEYIKDY